MANQEQLRTLKKEGVEVWNLWRKVHPDENIELEGADLDTAYFSNAYLNYAYLNYGYLRGANLTRADLTGAKLVGANLTGANLIGVQALQTNFDGATLTGASIKDWNINSKTNLQNVICDYIYFKQDQQERRLYDPKKNFEPGEFTKLFKIARKTVDLVFLDGIDWKAFLLSLNSDFSQINLKAQSRDEK